MRGIPIFIFIVFLIFDLKAQIYYNEHFQELKNKSGASYYKTIDSTENEIIEKTFYINDTINEIIHYSKSKDKMRQGKSLYYYENGKIKYDIDYSSNKLNGYLKGYFENGNKRRIDFYKNDTLIEGHCYTENGSDTAYYIYQKNASYKGQNLDAFRRFVARKVKYPTEAAMYGIQGRVIVEFCVNSKGEVVDINVVSSPNVLLSQAAIKTIKKSDLWEPGIQEGEKVKQKFVIPIDFKLD
jgi:TonB family protein